jgi:hypothetical protein
LLVIIKEREREEDKDKNKVAVEPLKIEIIIQHI